MLECVRGGLRLRIDGAALRWCSGAMMRWCGTVCRGIRSGRASPNAMSDRPRCCRRQRQNWSRVRPDEWRNCRVAGSSKRADWRVPIRFLRDLPAVRGPVQIAIRIADHRRSVHIGVFLSLISLLETRQERLLGRHGRRRHGRQGGRRDGRDGRAVNGWDRWWSRADHRGGRFDRGRGRDHKG